MRISDWSSDVCSSDLHLPRLARGGTRESFGGGPCNQSRGGAPEGAHDYFAIGKKRRRCAGNDAVATGCNGSERRLDLRPCRMIGEEDKPMELPSQTSAAPGGRSTALAAFSAVTVLFFAWGFITSLIDPLVAAVKGIFTLSDAEIGRAHV